MTKIPNDIKLEHILSALKELDQGIDHQFSKSRGYDVFFEGKRYPPKAVIGLAAKKVTGVDYGPYDLTGGLKSKHFKILAEQGFTIVSKGDTNPFPDEVDTKIYFEGSVVQVSVNRYERDQTLRAEAIKQRGTICSVCNFNFVQEYGEIGKDFIHVHHITPISLMGPDYEVNPKTDLVPVCPNCHAMLHKKIPPYTVKELTQLRLNLHR